MIAVNFIFIMTRDIERTMTEDRKNVNNTLFLKEIDEENVQEFFDLENDNLVYNIVTL